MDICIIMQYALLMRLSGQKYLGFMHMYNDLMSEMALFILSFIVVKSDVGVLISPGWSMIFTPTVIIVLLVSVFFGLMSPTTLT